MNTTEYIEYFEKELEKNKKVRYRLHADISKRFEKIKRLDIPLREMTGITLMYKHKVNTNFWVALHDTYMPYYLDDDIRPRFEKVWKKLCDNFYYISGANSKIMKLENAAKDMEYMLTDFKNQLLHDTTFKCSVCEKRFPRDHKWYYVNQVPSGYYLCGKCVKEL